MIERRAHVRTTVALEVALDDGVSPARHYRTRDISDGGMFVLLDGAPAPPLGTLVKVRLRGMVAGAPLLKMRVVRDSGEGVALRLCGGAEEGA